MSKDLFGTAATGNSRFEEVLESPATQEIINIWVHHGYTEEAARQYLSQVYHGEKVQQADADVADPPQPS